MAVAAAVVQFADESGEDAGGVFVTLEATRLIVNDLSVIFTVSLEHFPE